MVFSSILFIFYFLTTLLFIYYITPKKYRDIVLLLGSLVFYFLGEPKNIIFLILSGIINYLASLYLAKNKNKKILILVLIYNIGQLFIFKYTNFLLRNLNLLPGVNISIFNIALPIGISFYTFQAISYVVDVYNNKHKPSSNIIKFMTYLCLFPQLIAGPIVRYIDVEKDLEKCDSNTNDFYNGIKRFIIGLSKKILLANVLGNLIRNLTTDTILSAWLRPIGYTLQIYFDFSGYSDMAIGLGLMFGFHFLENFNYPLIANSITDFWRRWHISLSSWFKDYVYIPLGGNRVSKTKWIRNLFVVWFLTGLWHGASWNFILWGLYFGSILLIEKLFLTKVLDKCKIINHIYSVIIIIISFLIFSTDNVADILIQLKNMFFINNIPFVDNITLFYFRDYIVVILLAIIFSTPLVKKIKENYLVKESKLLSILEVIVYMGLFILSVAYIIDASYNPFLYFRF